MIGSTSIQESVGRHRGDCGKACYGSKASADRTVRQLQRSKKDQRYRGYLHSYVCRQCRAWHVGHQEYLH